VCSQFTVAYRCCSKAYSTSCARPIGAGSLRLQYGFQKWAPWAEKCCSTIYLDVRAGPTSTAVWFTQLSFVQVTGQRSAAVTSGEHRWSVPRLMWRRNSCGRWEHGTSTMWAVLCSSSVLMRKSSNLVVCVILCWVGKATLGQNFTGKWKLIRCRKFFPLFGLGN
jgi:hypothetical protein